MPSPTDAPPAGVAPAAPKTGAQKTAACPACGKANTLDSKFCRYCGIGLALVTVPVPGAAASAAAKHPAANGTANTATANGNSTNGATASSATNGAGGQPAAAQAPATEPQAAPTAASGEALNPAEIDARRARQLLDRALLLSDKGDKAGAILACRQAIGLAPGLAAGYAMLGPLLERSGDPRGAMGAYEKVLSLEPASPIERDSLARLRAAARQAGASRAAGLFHFDAGELFNESPLDGLPTAPAVSAPTAAAPVTATPIPAVPAPAVVVPVPPAPVRAVPAVAVPVAVPAPAIVRPTQQFTVPSISATPLSAAPISGAPVVSPLPVVQPYLGAPDDEPAVIPRWVRVLRGENSFWMQSVPLSVIALASLGLLLWARGVASSRIVPPATPVEFPQPAMDNSSPRPAADETATPRAETSAAPTATPTPAFSISNDRNPPSAAAPAAPAAAPASPRPARANTPSRQPAMPRGTQPLAPEEPSIPPFSGMRPPHVASAPTPEPPVRAVPITPDNAAGGSSAGGAPLNPAGSGTRSYVRITTTHTPATAPTRPEARSRAAEAAAAEAARAGRTGGAISSASASIEGGRDTGWRYQQRALLFLEQGDNARAADDFRTAIAAYRDQINRGANTDQARTGIDACQNGLRLAQLRLR